MLVLNLGATNVTREEVHQMVLGVDTDGNGILDFAEFVHLIASARSSVSSALGQISELREAFSMYDTDGSGTLDAEEIQAALKNLGVEKPIEEVEDMINAIDDDGNGELTFGEFVQVNSLLLSSLALQQKLMV